MNPDCFESLQTDHLFGIRPTFSSTNDPSFEKYWVACQELIEKIIPESSWLDIRSCSSQEDLQASYYHLSRSTPIFQYELVPHSEEAIAVRMLCLSDFTEGAQHYIADFFSRWLVPGKILPCIGSLSVDFEFIHYPNHRFYFQQDFFRFAHSGDVSIALGNISRLIEEAKINILAVYHARYVSSLKSLSPQQRNFIIRENVSSLLNLPSANGERIGEPQMQRFLLKLTEEDTLGQVKKNISNLIDLHPQKFHQDLFYEMPAFTDQFRAHFATMRDPRHISKLIALHYLFKKTLLQTIQNAPQERHLSFKLLKTRLSGSDPILGILIGMNLLKETERFEKKHLIEAIQSCLPDARAISDSYVMDRREEKIRIFYLEIQKPDKTPFALQELRKLRQDLPLVLKRQVENVIHPIFMPRNEEEVLRNIVVLSKQIKFLRDLPQLTIHYEKQTDADISFLIVLVRVLKENDLPFKELLKSRESSVRFAIDEIRSAGSLKKRHPKEAVIFRAILEKPPFFRKDYSLDLKRARQKISQELRALLGEIRDFNGGMIHKQDEALEQLRKILSSAALSHEVLLENYFYSLRPGIAQTVLAPETLRTLFDLLLKVLAEDLGQKIFTLKSSSEGKFFFIAIGAAAPSFREDVAAAVAKLRIPSYDLTTTFLYIQEFATLGYIFRSEDSERRSLLLQTVQDAMLQWKINFSCQLLKRY